MADEYVTTGEAARILGISIHTMNKIVDQGVVRSWRLPVGTRHRRVNVADVKALLPPEKPKEGASE